MKQEYRFSTTEVLTILASVLYPDPDGDSAGTIVWWHGRPYPWPGPLGFGASIQESIGGDKLDKVAGIAHAAVLLHRLGSGPQTAGHASFGAIAGVLFDDYCGNVPLSELIRRLLKRPPPPPPWFEKLASAAMLSQLASNLQPGAVRDEIARGVEASVQVALKGIER